MLMWRQIQRVFRRNQEEQKLNWNMVSQTSYFDKNTGLFLCKRTLTTLRKVKYIVMKLLINIQSFVLNLTTRKVL